MTFINRNWILVIENFRLENRPNPKSTIPNPQSPIPNPQII